MARTSIHLRRIRDLADTLMSEYGDHGWSPEDREQVIDLNDRLAALLEARKEAPDAR